jgi:release factor glutamine methyltransferase
MSKARNIIKRITQPFLKGGLDFYYRKPRAYNYQGIEVMVHPEVFPPHLTLSTKILLGFISEIDLNNKSFLELGCGSGIIALFARKKGANVIASDINEIAIEYLKVASEKNKLEIECIQSDLFDTISQKSFDYIIINPPYYPKKPKNTKEQAWFCGEDFEYFEALFPQLKTYLSEENNTYMILSEDCDFQNISKIAAKNNIHLNSIFTTKKVGEKNTIYSTKNQKEY